MLLDEEFDHAGAALHRSLPRSPTEERGFWHRVESGSGHASAGSFFGFFGAATETTHNVFQTILTYLMRNKESLRRMREEYEKVLADKLKEEPSLKEAPKQK